MDLAGGGAGDDGGGLPVDPHPEAVVLADHGGGLACVDHPGLDLLAGDHYPASAGDPPLDGEGSARPRRAGPAAAGAAPSPTTAGEGTAEAASRRAGGVSAASDAT